MEPLLGEIKLFAGNFAPSGWYSCEGQLLPIVQNTALFSLLGTTYGGDGRSTFALPDLRGIVPVGYSSNGQAPVSQLPLVLGAKGGAKTSAITGGTIAGTLAAAGNITIGVANLPSHTHTATASLPATNIQIKVPTNNTLGPSATPSGNVLGLLNDSTGALPAGYAPTSDGSTLAAFSVAIPASPVNVTNANAGSGTPLPISLPITGAGTVNGTVNTLQPYLALIYIIAWQGVFPPRP